MYAGLFEQLAKTRQCIYQDAVAHMTQVGAYTMGEDAVEEMDLLVAITKLLFDRFEDKVEDTGETLTLHLSEKDAFSIPKDIRTTLVRVGMSPDAGRTPVPGRAAPVYTPQVPPDIPVQNIPVQPAYQQRPKQPQAQPQYTPPEPAYATDPEPLPEARTPQQEFVSASAPGNAPWEQFVPQEETPQETEAPVPENIPEDVAAEETGTPEEHLASDAKVMRLPASSLIYETYGIRAFHNKDGKPVGGPTDIRICIAPLTGVQPNVSNVPITVYAYAHGNVVQASSLDTKTVGRNIVTIQVDDFELMCRGGFTGTQFSSTIMTTGTSSAAGDTLEPVSKETGGHPSSGPGNLRTQVGDSEISIIPMSRQDEYIIVAQNLEFTDYYYRSTDMPNRMAVAWIDGTRVEFAGGWSGDIFEAEAIA
jgi:hypothetical protein